jgi:hypothetical protein
MGSARRTARVSIEMWNPEARQKAGLTNRKRKEVVEWVQANRCRAQFFARTVAT